MVRKVAGSGGMTTTTTDGDGRVHITRTAADGKVLKEDQWSPERLVLDSSLSSRLREPIPTKATPETAARTAKRVGGKVATYYALEKPVIPVDFSMGRLISRQGTPGTGHSPDLEQRIEQAKQGRLEEMAKSPEQQVQRARRKQAAQSPN